MRTDTGDKIVEYIKTHQRVRPHDLVREFRLSPVAVHKQLKRLIDSNTISKIGKPPLVYYNYTIDLALLKQLVSSVDKQEPEIEKSYLYISSSGKKLEGMEGFIQWVRETRQEIQFSQLVSEYVKIRQSANKHFSSFGWIDATHKIINTFPKVYIDKLLYQDFFALPKFGKTRLGQMVLYAKTSQSRILMREIVELIKPIITKIVKYYKIEAVSFIPPTIPRNLQLMKEMAFDLSLKMPEIKLDKIFAGPVKIAQKSLPRLEQRVENARSTIYPAKTNVFYKRILLIDDAVGSGATFNETAKKLRDDDIAKDKIIAYAIVGSMKGFDIISEI